MTTCHCGKEVPEHAGTQDDVLDSGEEHLTRCCDCYDALVADEPKFCAECAQ